MVEDVGAAAIIDKRYMYPDRNTDTKMGVGGTKPNITMVMAKREGNLREENSDCLKFDSRDGREEVNERDSSSDFAACRRIRLWKGVLLSKVIALEVTLSLELELVSVFVFVPLSVSVSVVVFVSSLVGSVSTVPRGAYFSNVSCAIGGTIPFGKESARVNSIWFVGG